MEAINATSESQVLYTAIKCSVTGEKQDILICPMGLSVSPKSLLRSKWIDWCLALVETATSTPLLRHHLYLLDISTEVVPVTLCLASTQISVKLSALPMYNINTPVSSE